MTITGKPKGASNRGAVIISRTLKATNGSRSEWGNNLRTDLIQQRVQVSFNTKDDLEFKPIGENIDLQKDPKLESYRISEIVECYAGDFTDFSNTLVLEVLKNQVREEIVLQFENEQEFRRTLFTYKYFKMRNRLAQSSSSSSSSGESSSEGSSSPSPSTKSRLSVDYSEGTVSNYVKAFDFSNRTNQFMKKFDDKGSYGFKSLDYAPNQKIKLTIVDQKENAEMKNSKPEYDLMQITDNNGVTHMSVESKNDAGEIDALIYTDVDYDSVDFSNGSSSSPETLDAPQKPQRRKQLLKRIKGRAPPPPNPTEPAEVVKGQVVRISIEKHKEPTRTVAQQPKTHMGSNGYESDREEWRSRSTFSSSAFHSLARPARRALAAYYRLSSSPSPPSLPTMTMRKPSPRNPRNLQTNEYPNSFQALHPEYVIVQQIDSKRNQSQQDVKKGENLFQKHEAKYGKMLFNKDYKRNPLGGSMTYLNISNRLYGLTDKLKEFGAGAQNKQTVWPVKNEHAKKEKGQLKPVIKKHLPQEGSKRPVVRTCSTEPPKKVTFSAFATVQVV